VTVPVVRFVIAGQEEAAPSLGRPYTVVYDGACKICNRLVQMLSSWDRRHLVEAVPSQAVGVQARYPWIPAQAFRESVQLIGPGGRTWQGAEAVEQLLDILPKGKLVSWVFSIPGVRPLADRVYRWVARNRYRLGCGEHCQYRPESVDYGEGVNS
jgi:predicted DCC family thiol-disulfide oxidoreductase YuxK